MRDLISALTRDAFNRPSRHVPALQNQSPVPFVGSAGSLFGDNSGGLPIGDRAYSAYGSVGTLFAIVSQIGNAFASTEWHLYKKSAARDKSRRKEVTNHAFNVVWNRPNQFYTSRFFRETVQQHLDLVGEGMFVLVRIGGVIVEMWPVRPDRMQPVKDPQKFMTGWIYQGPNGEDVPLNLEDVIQIKYPNPADPYRGMGPVQTVLSDMDAARYSAEWNKNFFINGARPGGIITVDYRMGDDEFNNFVNRWRQQHQGVANAHRVAVLENATWTDTNFSMADMQFAELRNLPRELIREAFAFPKPMLGTVDDVNRANAEAGKEIMAEGQTIPRLSRWRDILNNFLMPQFDKGKTLEVDYDDPTPINSEALDRQRVSQATAAGLLVTKGFDPKAVLEWAGLPDMPWVGIPGPAPAQSATTAEPDEPDESDSSDLSSLVEQYWK